MTFEKRVIKFKGWYPQAKKMLDLKAMTPLALSPDLNQDGLFLPFSDDIVLLQYTGINDKHNREIYDGHIIKKDDIDYLFFVDWNPTSAAFWLMTNWNNITDFPEPMAYVTAEEIEIIGPEKLGNGYYKRTDLEIVGNIFQNLELITNEPTKD